MNENENKVIEQENVAIEEPKKVDLPETSDSTGMSTGQKVTGIFLIITWIAAVVAWIVVGIKKLVGHFKKDDEEKVKKPKKEKKIKKAKEEPAEEVDFEIIEEEEETEEDKK